MSHALLRHLSQGHLGIMAPVNHDLVQFPVSTAEMQGHQLVHHGGPTLTNPKAWLVFLNDFWGDWHEAERVTRDILEGGYLDGLGPYGSGNGTLLGVVQITRSIITGAITDSFIRQTIGQCITSGELPPPDAETMYILCTPKDVRVVFDGDHQGSCETWCGYHSNFFMPDGRGVIYTVQPDSRCSPCGGGWKGFTTVLSHEIAEACTDPFATGWYCDHCGGENADLVAWIEFRYNGDWVQGYYRNENGGENYVGQYIPEDQRPGHQPSPEPEPEPPPAVDEYARGYSDGATAGYRAALADMRKAVTRLEEGG